MFNQLERQYLANNVKLSSQLSLHINVDRFTRFSSSYDLFLQPEAGLVSIKPKHVAVMFVTMKQLVQ
jgi:hypothetical protein